MNQFFFNIFQWFYYYLLNFRYTDASLDVCGHFFIKKFIFFYTFYPNYYLIFTHFKILHKTYDKKKLLKLYAEKLKCLLFSLIVQSNLIGAKKQWWCDSKISGNSPVRKLNNRSQCFHVNRSKQSDLMFSFLTDFWITTQCQSPT